MKKSISLLLAIIMLFSVVSVSAFAATIATPKATSSNDVGGIKVYWNKVDSAVKYNVYRRVGGSSSWMLVGTTTGTQVIDKGVTNGIYYVYSVRAYNSQGDYSAYNQSMTYTTKCVATPKLTSLTNDTNGLKLTWSAVSGATYRVYRRGAGSTTWTYLGTTSSTTYTDSKATSGKYWRYTVRAASSGYYSGFDTNGLYTMRLANPYSIKAVVVQNGVQVNWAKINGATGYRVYRRGAGESTWTCLGATSGNTFTDAKVVYGNYYRYTVRATRGNVFSWFHTNTPVLKYYPAYVTMSGSVGVVNSKLYAVADTGHKKNSEGSYSVPMSNPVIPRLPVRKGDIIGEFCYYNGYVYYTAGGEGSPWYSHSLYRCNPDFTGHKLIIKNPCVEDMSFEDQERYNNIQAGFIIIDNKIYPKYTSVNSDVLVQCVDLNTLKVSYTTNAPDISRIYGLDRHGLYIYNNTIFTCENYEYSEGEYDYIRFGSNQKTLYKGKNIELLYGCVNGYLYFSQSISEDTKYDGYDRMLKRVRLSDGYVEIVDKLSAGGSSDFFNYRG